MEYSIFGIVILILDVIAVLSVWGSGATTTTKLLWTLLIVILPVIGLIAWFFLALLDPQQTPLPPPWQDGGQIANG